MQPLICPGKTVCLVCHFFVFILHVLALKHLGIVCNAKFK